MNEPIPAGIYFCGYMSRIGQQFQTADGKYLGDKFGLKWKKRWKEFPKGPPATIRDNKTTDQQ